jgi:hypothetical protein
MPQSSFRLPGFEKYDAMFVTLGVLSKTRLYAKAMKYILFSRTEFDLPNATTMA